MSGWALEPVRDLQEIRGIPFAAGVGYRQIVVTGPPGCGKSTLVRMIGGWPEEGYLDLTAARWWRSRSLTFRPREVHLGFPFRGLPEALAVFEEAFLTASEPLRLELERILLPPERRRFGFVDWRRRYDFEFLLPPAEEMFAALRGRSHLRTHPVDVELTLEHVARQLAVYAETAHLFHRMGLEVHVRDGFEEPPKRFARRDAVRGGRRRRRGLLGGSLKKLIHPDDARPAQPDADEPPRRTADRERRLAELRGLIGDALRPLAPEPALEQLDAAIRALETAPHRPVADDGLAGGLVELPDELVPVLVGDLHANLDNLLTLLTEDGLIAELERGSTALVLLGDAVHPQEGRLGEMESSVVITDLIIKMMLAFPGRVIYLRGNHESFSHEVTKRGVEQGRLWCSTLRQLRGDRFIEQMKRFYRLAPYVVVARGMIACHAGPPLGKVTRQRLIDVRHHPKLKHQLTWNRLRRPGKPFGYGKRDVVALRKALGASKTDAVIVSHNPLSEDRTVWLDAGGIRGHHVVYSANDDAFAVFTRRGGEMVPVTYRAEPLVRLLEG